MKISAIACRVCRLQILFLLLVAVVVNSCRSSNEQQDDGIPENILQASEFSTQLENFTFGGDDDFLDDSFEMNGDFLAERSSEDDIFSGSAADVDMFANFANNANFADFENGMVDGFVPMDFNQSSEEVNSSLNNDTQFFANNATTNQSNFFAFQNMNSSQDNFAGDSSSNLFVNNAFNDSAVDFADTGVFNNASMFRNNTVMNTPPPAAPPIVNEVPSPALASPPASIPEPVAEIPEILPAIHMLTWVGFEYDQEAKKLRVEMITRGSPEFQVFQESNQAGQPEFVFRFLQTNLRRKIRRDIDASEFRSPVAYIRMRHDPEQSLVDVVLTLRDPVQPLFYAKDGNVLLTFDLPDRYFDNRVANDVRPIDQAQPLSAYQLALDIQEGSDLPKVSFFQPDPARGMFEGSGNQAVPIDRVMQSAPDYDFDEFGFPPSFDSGWNLTNPEDLFPEEFFHVRSSTFLSVGQEDFDNFAFDDADFDFNAVEFGDGEEVNAANNEEFEDFSGNQLNSMENFGSFPEDSIQVMDQNFAPTNDLFLDNFNDGGTNFVPEVMPSASDSEVMFDDFMMGNQNIDTSLFNSMSDAAITESFGFDDMDNGFKALTPAQDIMGQDRNSRSPPQYDGRLVYMEFTEAPLSIVFRTFSAETNNNFIFPREVGDLPITIHFQGVPWDEALKGILETHSLGMVRVGANVVRVDAIDRLTQYMQQLEEAKAFESRRIPTKVLVMRLNNARAEEILERITPLVERDMEIDPRIKLAADQRTNSIVMEAPDFILSKTKNVVERLDLETPQVEIASRIVEIQKNQSNFFGAGWINRALANFDPGRGLGFGSLNFPNNMVSSFAVDPGVVNEASVGNAQFRFGSINRFIDLDLILRMEERRGTTNILQSNRVLVLDGQEAVILAGNSKFFRPAAGGTVVNQGDGAGGGDAGLAEVKFNLSLEVRPQVTADGSVIMDLNITSDTPGDPTGEVLADKNTRELRTQMIRESGDTGVIGGIYDTQRVESIIGVPFFSRIPLIGALFRSTNTVENQTELLIMVTPTIVSGRSGSGQAASGSMRESNFFGSNSSVSGPSFQDNGTNFFGSNSGDGFDFNSNLGSMDGEGFSDDFF